MLVGPMLKRGRDTRSANRVIGSRLNELSRFVSQLGRSFQVFLILKNINILPRVCEADGRGRYPSSHNDT